MVSGQNAFNNVSRQLLVVQVASSACKLSQIILFNKCDMLEDDDTSLNAHERSVASRSACRYGRSLRHVGQESAGECGDSQGLPKARLSRRSIEIIDMPDSLSQSS